jgi:hypothetical protein
MIRFLEIKNNSKFRESIKKKTPTTKQNLNRKGKKKKKHKIYLALTSLPLLSCCLLMLVLLLSLISSFAPKNDYFHMSRCGKKI